MYGRAVVATEYQSSLMLVRYKNTLDPAAQCNAKPVTEKSGQQTPSSGTTFHGLFRDYSLDHIF